MLKSAEQIVKRAGLPGTALNVLSAGMAAKSGLGAIDTALDDRDHREGDPSALTQASDSASWLTSTPGLINRFGTRGNLRRGALGALSLPSTVGGAYEGLTSGNLADTAFGALDAGMAYQGGKEVFHTGKQFLKSPIGQRSVAFLNNQAVPAARNAYNAAKPAVTNAIKATPGAIKAIPGAISSTYSAAKPVMREGGAMAGKFLGKKIPLVGLGIGLGLAGERAYSGDWLGAAGEALSGAASTVPGIGTAASTAIDAGLIARDKGYFKNPVNPTQTKGSLSASGTLSGPTLPDTKVKMQAMPTTPTVPKINYPTANSLSYTPKISIGNPTGMPATKTDVAAPKISIGNPAPTTAAVAKPASVPIPTPAAPKPAPVDITNQTAKPIPAGGQAAPVLNETAVAGANPSREIKPMTSPEDLIKQRTLARVKGQRDVLNQAAQSQGLDPSRGVSGIVRNGQAVSVQTPEKAAPVELPQNYIPLAPKTEPIAPQPEQPAPQQKLNLNRVNRVVAGPDGKAVGVGGGIMDKMKAEGRIPQDFQLTPAMRIGEEALPAEIQAAKKEYMAGLTPNISAPSEALAAARSHYNSLEKPKLTGAHPKTGQPMAANSAENRALSEWSTERINARHNLNRLEQEDNALRARENTAIAEANKRLETAPAPKIIAANPRESAPLAKSSQFRRNTGIVENGEVWINPKDRAAVEKLGFSWEEYSALPAYPDAQTAEAYFKNLNV